MSNGGNGDGALRTLLLCFAVRLEPQINDQHHVHDVGGIVWLIYRHDPPIGCDRREIRVLHRNRASIRQTDHERTKWLCVQLIAHFLSGHGSVLARS